MRKIKFKNKEQNFSFLKNSKIKPKSVFLEEDLYEKVNPYK